MRVRLESNHRFDHQPLEKQQNQQRFHNGELCGTAQLQLHASSKVALEKSQTRTQSLLAPRDNFLEPAR
ncbi:hypothetical protein R2R35_14015 [Anaerocolumna sp. AGMB13020]|uniref:hypothetical protein n=1 Tax=Anaerocolumna sp. AGMB13020 TaxID=3081750 RepID=UPI002952BD8F|nr:hypothetical protein [Anaerocolumna sp. AGMB13020]WOO34913.1 hypothetical protein R2R35_14015 [Anaerocolumna sp. AGMB13020]